MSIRSALSHPLIAVLLFSLSVRIATSVLAFLANVVFPLNLPEQFTLFAETHAFWDTFARWDSGWYLGIARDGYRFVEGGRSNLAFFPVYPTVVGYIGRLLGGETIHYALGGILISWAAFGGAMVGLYRLARLDLDEAAAFRAVVFAAVFPFAFFFGLIYSESVFLCALVWTFYLLRTGRWMVAALAGGIAVCTRVNGIMAFPAFVVAAWPRARVDRQASMGAAVSLTTIVAAFGAWCGYNYALSGSAFEWAHSIRRWGYHPGTDPLLALWPLAEALWTRGFQFLTTERMAPYDTLNGAAAMLALALTPFVWWRLGAAYGVFMVANLTLPLSSGQYEGLGRYCSVLFPVFVWLAAFGSPLLHSVVLFSWSALYMLCLALFTKVHPLF